MKNTKLLSFVMASLMLAFVLFGAAAQQPVSAQIPTTTIVYGGTVADYDNAVALEGIEIVFSSMTDLGNGNYTCGDAISSAFTDEDGHFSIGFPSKVGGTYSYCVDVQLPSPFIRDINGGQSRTISSSDPNRTSMYFGLTQY
jgi:hypothetical protein